MSGFYYQCERCKRPMRERRNDLCNRCEDLRDSQEIYSESGVLYIPTESEETKGDVD